MYVLKSDKLNMEESDILEKVKEWANISSVSGYCTHIHRYPLSACACAYMCVRACVRACVHVMKVCNIMCTNCVRT